MQEKEQDSQDISTAGKQAGIKEGTRSGLFYELMRVIRLVRPKYVVLENVSAILANGFETVLAELAQAGLDAEWACIPASAVGACHQRDRWWLVAYSSNVLSNGSASKQQGQPRRKAIPQPRNCDWADAANANNAGLQRRQPAIMRECATKRPTWTRNSQSNFLRPDWRSYVSEPVLCRGDDGLSGRVDRIKALGNAVVPQVAMIPLRRVLELASPCAEGVYSIRRDAPA